VFARAQATARGFSTTIVDRRLTSGVWERLYPGVYRLAGVPATWRQALFAACLAWGDGAVVSHRAAASLWGFPGFEPSIELSVPRRRERAHAHLVHRPGSLAAVDVTTVDAIPVTTPVRTLIDVAGCVEADVLEEALDDALRSRLVTIGRMRWRLRELGKAGRRGSRLLGELVDARGGVARGPESVLETRLLRALRAAGLPRPAVQYKVGAYRVDFAYPDARVAIEADGFRWHSTRQQWDNDRARRNALTALGWTLIHVTWSQLQEHPDEVIATIRATLASR
jgi:very-short-patch-repair endonuclease